MYKLENVYPTGKYRELHIRGVIRFQLSSWKIL